MRLFFALTPDSNTRNQLSAAADQVRSRIEAVMVSPENYHVTLAFVGDVHESKLPSYFKIGAALSVPRLPIELNAYKYWPSSQAVVLAARDNPRSIEEQTASLRASISALKPVRSAEHFWRAHVTLARKVAQAPVLAMASPVTWVSSSFALMRSETGGERSVYTVVANWPLLDEAWNPAESQQTRHI